MLELFFATFIPTLGGLTPFVLAGIGFFLFFRYIDGRTSAFRKDPIIEFLDTSSKIEVHLRSGQVMKDVSYLGCTNDSQHSFVNNFGGCIAFVDHESRKYIVKSKDVKMIVVVNPSENSYEQSC